MDYDDYNYEEAMQVDADLLGMDMCDDPDAVEDLLNDEYNINPYNFSEPTTSQKTDKSSGICILIISIFLITWILV